MDQLFLISAVILLVLGLFTLREGQTAWLKIQTCLDAARHCVPCRFDDEWDLSWSLISFYAMMSITFIGTGIGFALVPILCL